MDRRERFWDTEEQIRMAQDSHASQIWTALPGIVEAVDVSAQTVSVQPAIQGVVADAAGTETAVNLPLLVDVPICWPRAGGFALTFPVKKGDEVLVVFASRCIDSWWQSGGVGAQAEARMHDLSDGFAVLAPTSQAKKLENVSAENVQLRDEAGTSYIEITPAGKIKITAEAQIDMEAPLINIKGNVVHTAGTITSLGRKIDGTHTHPGDSGGTTGVPNA
jgi:hypothetical protein